MATSKRKRPTLRGWMRPLELRDEAHLPHAYGVMGAKIDERAVTVQLGSNAKLDIFLEDDGTLHVVALTATSPDRSSWMCKYQGMREAL